MGESARHDAAGIPQSFKLLIAAGGRSRACDVLHKRERRIEVEFVGA